VRPACRSTSALADHFGHYHGQPFFVMELSEGQSLNERIANKPIPISNLVHLTLQTCDALQAAHDKRIIHRDIKPANIFLSANGQIKVLDFGRSLPKKQS
jgi:eukaryotic-like serine/threonine-protein kinase